MKDFKDLIRLVIVDNIEVFRTNNISTEHMFMLIDIKLCNTPAGSEEVECYASTFSTLNKVLREFVSFGTEGVFTEKALDYVKANPDQLERYLGKRLDLYRTQQEDAITLYEKLFGSKVPV